MSAEFVLEGTARSEFGKGASRRLRREADKLPAIVYGAGKEVVPFTLAQNKVRKALENEAFYSHILTLKIDGKAEKVVIKDLQRHPYKKIVMHMDFLRVSASEKLTMKVPVHFINADVAPGVKESGGIVSHLETEIEISCLPANLPEFIEVDIAKLELDQSIHLSEIKAPEGVELNALHHDPVNDLALASIHMPRVEAEPEPEEAAEGEEAADGDAKSDDKAEETPKEDGGDAAEKKDGE